MDASASFNDDTAFAETVFRYMDGELSVARVERLNGLLTTSARHRTLFNDIALQSMGLKEYSSALEKPASLDHRGQTLSVRRTVLVAASLVVVLAVCFGVWLFSDARATGIAALKIDAVSGDVSIVNMDGESRPARAGDEIVPDETLSVEDSSGSVELRLGSWLRMEVFGPASATWTRERELVVHEGEFNVLISSGSPLQLETLHTSLSVQDAEFTLLAADTWTEVEVRSGEVSLAGGSSGERATVVAEETVVAQQGFPLVIHDSAQSVPTEWREDFETGVPIGWRGRFSVRGLPDGSRGGIGVMTETRPDATQFLIEANDQAIRVLLTENSHLNLTCRLENPTWFNLFILTRGSDGVEPDYILNRFQTAPILERAGEWRTVRIPVAEFETKRSGEFIDQPPAVGGVVVGVLFSAFDNDLELTIDDISITSDGPGAVTFETSED